MAGQGSIMIVDDDPEVRHALCEALKGLDREIVLAHDGQVALDLAASHEIAVALIDLVMPVVGGQECLRKMRLLSPNTSCIMVSGMSNGHKVITACIEAGALTLLPKPVDTKQLVRVTESALDTYRQKLKQTGHR